MGKKLFGGDDQEEQTREQTPAAAKDPAKLKEQKKAAFLKMKARKDSALALLISLAQRMGDEDEKKAAEYLTPGHRTASGPKAPKVKEDMIAKIFGDSDTVHEDKIFMDFKLGRPDMAKLIKQAVNQNIWISFDAGNGIYSVVRGAMPEGWLGPLPKAPKVE